VLDRLASPDVAAPEQVEVVETVRLEGLEIQRLQWRLPYGPPTEAVLLKPADATGPLPGFLALHCHGGRKCWGWRKIARTGEAAPPLAKHHERYYQGRTWANELAKRGYVVLAHDAFAFASRQVRMADCPPTIRGEPVDPACDDAEAVAAYDEWASSHEHLMAKSLFSAGTTWPGVFFAEDRVALDVLARRDDVDASRLGCGGLSGGAMRTVLLAGLDERIRCCVAVGFMSTWRDYLLWTCHTHTWMTYIPLLPNELDYPEILAMRAPAATMVLNNTEDPLFVAGEVRRSGRIMEEVFSKAKGPGNLVFDYYPGPHKFDVAMQKDAFEFIGRHLKGPARQEPT
jgi:dienelactone hydrolase